MQIQHTPLLKAECLPDRLYVVVVVALPDELKEPGRFRHRSNSDFCTKNFLPALEEPGRLGALLIQAQQTKHISNEELAERIE